MRSFARRLATAAVAILSLTGLPYLGYLGLYLLLDPDGSPANKRSAEPSVSVVLPTYNEERIVRRKLEELVSLDYPSEKVEVVVVDSSDDATPEIVREFFADRDAPTLTLVEEESRRGVAAATNAAVAAASNDVIFRTDTDSKVADDALREAVANLADPDIGAVTGRQTEVLGDSAVESDYRDLMARLQALESHLDSTFICHGPCFAFRREAFAPLPTDTVADDTAIGVNVRRGGQRVVMDPAMRFVESGVSAFGERRVRKDRRAVGLLQLLFRHRDALGQYGAYGRAVLPFNWWFMVASPWLLAGAAFLGSVAAVGLAGPFGLVVPIGVVVLGWLGQRDRLGPVQPLYAVADSQVSLLVAGVRLLSEEGDGTWEIDRESRRAFEAE